ncbi:prepilin-type N-terminal cleavage/methylation domain-containing protein [Candidatus Saccharibacteria bacterium]|nr:prepilin-type N-terminal cleavage/methylation domain-containing protein [Candidatus Saccharibacteria bacterium]
MKATAKKTLKTKKAFTLTELTLALAIIGVLFIMIATIIANMISIYQKGTTITAVNDVGRSIIADISDTITDTPPFSASVACSFILHLDQESGCRTNPERTTVVIKTANGIGNIGSSVPTGGAFCTGKYSYIWNSGYVLPGEDGNEAYNNGGSHKSTIKYRSNAGETTIKDFRLIKIQDKKRLACISQYNNSFDVDNNSTEYNLINNNAISEEPVELIASSDKRLALYSFDVVKTENTTTNRSLYSVSFILGTIRGGINITGNSNYCAVPNDADSDFDYCAINKFNFAIRTAGE